MKAAIAKSLNKGLTILEVSAILAILTVLAFLILAALSGAKRVAKGMSCTNNLKQIGLAVRIFANDHRDYFPMEISLKEGGTKEFAEFGLVVPHYLVMTTELSTPQVLVCPADKRTAAPDFNELRDGNISYFVGLDAKETNSHSLFSGDRNVDDGSALNKRMMLVGSNQPLKWTKKIHQNYGNVLTSDGSVQQAIPSRLSDLLRDSGVATNRLAIP
ncbi:MAG: hypothetical protein DME19_13595 [Verrucomicrobia bacterium]|nr:MAG: hypothetical protein DME19_13595 [Verrucomicrobiota bacterium]